jgi:membrane fusion protein (multidrug efflux system)
MKSKGRVWIAAVVGLVVVIATLAGIKVAQIRAMIQAGKAFSPPPEAVTSAKVEASRWRSRQAAIGSLVAVHDVTLGAEFPGLVQSVDFDSGQLVKRGAVMARLDVTNEVAQLESATADAALAQTTVERARKLRQGGANTQAELDAAEARAKQTVAVVSNLKATIAKKTIHAPFDGRVAIRQIERGQVISPGTSIATLQSVDPIYAEFALPQQALGSLTVGQAVTVTVDSFPGATWDGKISTVNSEVDVSTRNVRVRATLPNKDGRLRPGLFVNVEVNASDEHDVLVIPATAVVYAPYGDSVFVIQAGPGGDKAAPRAVEPRFVRLGERRGDLVAAISGLKAGETIVSNGAFKLHKGMQVIENNALAPKAELDPKPTDR